MKKVCMLLIVSVFLGLCSCNRKAEYIQKEFVAMDTTVIIKIPQNAKNSEEIFGKCREIIEEAENAMSRTVLSSEVSCFNEADSEYTMSDAVIEVINKALDVSAKTEGAYDVTITPVVDLWNISGGGYVPTSEELTDALENVGFRNLSVSANKLVKNSKAVEIDLGGIAKGYALGKVCEYLGESVDYAIVNFGGNVGVVGTKPDKKQWMLGIKNPFDTDSIIGYITADDGYLAISGDYERYFESNGVLYTHIFNPATGLPMDNSIHSVAVHCNDAALGDALSTALYVMGTQKALEFYKSGVFEFEALIITEGQVIMTDGMKDMYTEYNAG